MRPVDPGPKPLLLFDGGGQSSRDPLRTAGDEGAAIFSQLVHDTGERLPRLGNPGRAVSDPVVVPLLVAAGNELEKDTPAPQGVSDGVVKEFLPSHQRQSFQRLGANELVPGGGIGRSPEPPFQVIFRGNAAFVLDPLALAFTQGIEREGHDSASEPQSAPFFRLLLCFPDLIFFPGGDIREYHAAR